MRKVWLWLINEEGVEYVVAFVKILSPDLGTGLRKTITNMSSEPSLEPRPFRALSSHESATFEYQLLNQRRVMSPVYGTSQTAYELLIFYGVGLSRVFCGTHARCVGDSQIAFLRFKSSKTRYQYYCCITPQQEKKMESGKTKTRGRVSQDGRNNFWDVTRGISTALPVVKRCGGMWTGMWEGRQPGPSLCPLSLGRIFKYLYTERIHTKPFYNFFSYALQAKHFDDDITEQTLAV